MKKKSSESTLCLRFGKDQLKIDAGRPTLGGVAQIIEEDKAIPEKQRHTAKRIYERIREMGYGGKYTQVKEAVREITRVKQEVFMPLMHRVGEAQVDFGYALAKVSSFPYRVSIVTPSRLIFTTSLPILPM